MRWRVQKGLLYVRQVKLQVSGQAGWMAWDELSCLGGADVVAQRAHPAHRQQVKVIPTQASNGWSPPQAPSNSYVCSPLPLHPYLKLGPAAWNQDQGSPNVQRHHSHVTLYKFTAKCSGYCTRKASWCQIHSLTHSHQTQNGSYVTTQMTGWVRSLWIQNPQQAKSSKHRVTLYTIIIIIDNFCIALFSGVPKLTALYILQHFLSFTNIIHIIMTTNNV